VVADSDAHRGSLTPGFVERVTGGVAYIFKSAVAFVQIKVVWRGVVAHQQVKFAIVVDVSKHRAEPVVPRFVGYSGLLTHVCKGAIAVVMEKMVGLALQAS